MLGARVGGSWSVHLVLMLAVDHSVWVCKGVVGGVVLLFWVWSRNTTEAWM